MAKNIPESQSLSIINIKENHCFNNVNHIMRKWETLQSVDYSLFSTDVCLRELFLNILINVFILILNKKHLNNTFMNLKANCEHFLHYQFK